MPRHWLKSPGSPRLTSHSAHKLRGDLALAKLLEDFEIPKVTAVRAAQAAAAFDSVKSRGDGGPVSTRTLAVRANRVPAGPSRREPLAQGLSRAAAPAASAA
jgi:hypothetical protein